MRIPKSIVLNEYPKSGGSWIVSLLGEVLKVPQRDIYVKPGFNLFDLEKHPWYKEGGDLDYRIRSVIKSHELPGSMLIDFDATYVHLVRDGRDVVVSKWYFEKDFCVQNGITSSFEDSFDEYLEKTAYEWAHYVSSWMQQSVVTIRYENFLMDPIRYLECCLLEIGCTCITRKELESAVSKYTKDKFKTSLGEVFKHNTFVRKGISGDWRNHFSADNVAAFKRVAGDELLALGYELNSDWNV